MFGTFIPAFLFAIAQTEIDSSVTSILNSLTPLKHLVLGALVLALVLKDRFGVF
jgi:drug/metabolite transporter (DMT)-like permease